ncbi:histone deacetylase [Streptomycetaceae bacterium NBC_01309]
MTADGDRRRGVPDKVWYAAYGSNMHLARLAYYLRGGRPPDAARTYPGCRDRSLPARAVPVFLPGSLYFALESRAWTGGMGFHDPAAEGVTPARAYLVSVSQFSDIAAQEMHREPGEDIDLGRVLAEGQATLGPGRYETLLCPGALDGYPVLTFTAPWRLGDVEPNSPAPGYLRNLASGLGEAHGWSVSEVSGYLARRPGALGCWSPGEIAELVRPPEAA